MKYFLVFSHPGLKKPQQPWSKRRGLLTKLEGSRIRDRKYRGFHPDFNGRSGHQAVCGRSGSLWQPLEV
jgi:hypothetical protein